MPRAATHWKASRAVGVVAPPTFYILAETQKIPGALFEGSPFSGLGAFLYWVGAIVCSTVGGMLPDILEPAFIYGPKHRGVLHSFLFLAGLVVLEYLILYGRILTGADDVYFYVRNVLFYLALGYLTHLLLDWW